MNQKRYNMKEVARELGVARQTLYYWLKKDWIKPKRDYRNYPIFTRDDIKQIKEWKNKINEA